MSELSRLRGSEGYVACDDEVPCGCPAPRWGAVRSLLVPGEPETVRGLRGGFRPQIQPGKILPRLRRQSTPPQGSRATAQTLPPFYAFRGFQPLVNQGFFTRPQRGLDRFILFPRKRRSKCVQMP